jgi:hypothetical protein
LKAEIEKCCLQISTKPPVKRVQTGFAGFRSRNLQRCVKTRLNAKFNRCHFSAPKENTMKKEWADKWVAALRSGEFSQGVAALCVIREGGPRYCCLGVLCEVVRREEGEPISESHGDRSYWGSSCTLPDHVREVTGIKSSHGERPDDPTDDKEKTFGGGLSLVGDNDSRSYNFARIADLIERHWAAL